MSTESRDEVARAVAKKLDLPASFIDDVPVAKRVWMLGQVWDALIDAELRVQELREALEKLAKGNRSPGVLEIARKALSGLSEESKS